MTGYGRAERQRGRLSVVIEARSVNHRFCEVNVKSTGRLFLVDDHVKKVVKQRFERGYFDIAVTLGSADDEGVVVVNEPLLAAYMNVAERLGREYGVAYPPSFGDLMQAKDILTVQNAEVAPEEWVDLLDEALGDALNSLATMRGVEGEATLVEVRGRLREIGERIDIIKKTEEAERERRFEHLRERIATLIGDSELDEGRLAQEAAIIADRADICEEIERLSSHLQQVEELLDNGGPLGRKLEFYVQEIGRENNTIGSKTGLPESTASVVRIKSELEKIREQAQNFE